MRCGVAADIERLPCVSSRSRSLAVIFLPLFGITRRAARGRAKVGIRRRRRCRVLPSARPAYAAARAARFHFELQKALIVAVAAC
ncbi:hypothetical protein EZV77_07635 [Burkholderia thailandensis]|nr:hypothetical protein A8H32_20115 [Burkholderia thailandensis]MDD1483257.1 hypothetical protein [Burkholderia thailandensis]MDD1489339.1 hypothetical protein [Burkholderia thailandensis]MDD1495622.1 hypothetical protein [Burkholderia thailandensis]PJO72934.1 hypothetical protein CWD92_07120 [Burkholderia thailandensis]